MGSWSFFEQKEKLVGNFAVDPWRACPAVEFSSRSSVFASLHEIRALRRYENRLSTPLAPPASLCWPTVCQQPPGAHK